MSRGGPRIKVNFATHSFYGGRFSDHTMDVDALSELAAYKKLVREVARWLYFQKHPDRKRTPRGLMSSFDLSLSDTEHNCFSTQLQYSVVGNMFTSIDPDNAHKYTSDIFTEARDYISEVTRRAASGLDLPNDFHGEVAAAFSQFGQALRSEEYILIRMPDDVTSAKYTREVRAALLRRAHANYEDSIEVSGEVRAVDVDAEKFRIKVNDGKNYYCRFSTEDRNMLTKALGSADSALVIVSGVGEFAPSGELQKIVRVLELRVNIAPRGADVNALQIDRQIKRLQGRHDLGEFGTIVLDAAQLAWVGEILHEVTDYGQVPLPYLYPTPSGGVQAEWTSGSWEISTSFDLKTRGAYLIAANVDTGVSLDETIVNVNETTCEDIVEFVSSFLPATNGGNQ